MPIFLTSEQEKRAAFKGFSNALRILKFDGVDHMIYRHFPKHRSYIDFNPIILCGTTMSYVSWVIQCRDDGAVRVEIAFRTKADQYEQFKSILVKKKWAADNEVNKIRGDLKVLKEGQFHYNDIQITNSHTLYYCFEKRPGDRFYHRIGAKINSNTIECLARSFLDLHLHICEPLKSSCGTDGFDTARPKDGDPKTFLPLADI
jgi:hypothetical protein